MTTRIDFNNDGLLCAYEGTKETFIWDYSVFEELIHESITPSMYHFMAGYIRNNITKYGPSVIPDAVDEYFAQPLVDRIEQHEQELVNLRSAKRRAEAKESAAIDAMLSENKPFDHTSPIDKEYSDFMRGIIERERKAIERLEREIFEEEHWRGGHEEGESDLETDECYDQMDEF